MKRFALRLCNAAKRSVPTLKTLQLLMDILLNLLALSAAAAYLL